MECIRVLFRSGAGPIRPGLFPEPRRDDRARSRPEPLSRRSARIRARICPRQARASDVPPGDHDLRRVERSAARDHRQDVVGVLSVDLKLSDAEQNLRDALRGWLDSDSTFAADRKSTRLNSRHYSAARMLA